MIAVTMMVLCQEETDAAKVGEAFGRVAAGIALEGITVTVSFTTVDDEEEP